MQITDGSRNNIERTKLLPRFSLSSHVRTESLYGMKSLFFFFLLCNRKKHSKNNEN